MTYRHTLTVSSFIYTAKNTSFCFQTLQNSLVFFVKTPHIWKICASQIGSSPQGWKFQKIFVNPPPRDKIPPLRIPNPSTAFQFHPTFPKATWQVGVGDGPSFENIPTFWVTKIWFSKQKKAILSKKFPSSLGIFWKIFFWLDPQTVSFSKQQCVSGKAPLELEKIVYLQLPICHVWQLPAQLWYHCGNWMWIS